MSEFYHSLIIKFKLDILNKKDTCVNGKMF